MIITTVTTDNSAILPIGRQDEHGVRQVWFDLTWLIENFGEGTPVLLHQRTEDLSPYPVTAERVGNNLIWKIDEIDTAFEGIGRAEIRWTVDNDDDDVGKTVIYKTNVLKSLTSQREIPDPLESWYEKLLEQIGDNQEYAEQAAQSAQDASQSAQDAETAASAAAEDAVDAVQTELNSLVQQATQSAQNASQSAQEAEQAAGTAATDAANAVRSELSGLAQQAAQSATNAANSADRAEQTAEAIEAASVVLTASDMGSGVVTISASINRG